MRHYLVTALDTERRIVQVAVEIDPADARFSSPIKCPVSAASRKFWARYLAEYGVDRVTKAQPIQGYVAAGGAGA